MEGGINRRGDCGQKRTFARGRRYDQKPNITIKEREIWANLISNDSFTRSGKTGKFSYSLGINQYQSGYGVERIDLPTAKKVLSPSEIRPKKAMTPSENRSKKSYDFVGKPGKSHDPVWNPGQRSNISSRNFGQESKDIFSRPWLTPSYNRAKKVMTPLENQPK